MFDDSELPPPRGYVSPLRSRQDSPSVDAGVSVPVGAVDFEEDAEVEQPEVGGADEAAVAVAEGELLDVADADAVEDASDSSFQFGNDGHEASLAPEMPVGEILEGDCIEVMRSLPPNSVDAIVADPPYGLEFMQAEWDTFRNSETTASGRQTDTWGGFDNPYARSATPRYTGQKQPKISDQAANWEHGSGFQKPGIGERETPWPSFSSTSRFGEANPTCADCGGRLRGAKKCTCEEPNWKPITKRRNAENEGLPDDQTGAGYVSHLREYQRWTETWAREAYRVLKPGGHIVVFGGTRTHHRQSVAIEDAGFEIRDEMQWVYLSGFPKSRDVSRDIDRILGSEREVIGSKTVRDIRRQPGRPVGWGLNAALREKDEYIERDVTVPASDEAKQWAGYGTALKPAHEPILLARKPLVGTVATNLLRYGTGALNIDGTRIPVESGDEYIVNTFDNGAKPFGGAEGEPYTSRTESKGRWPSNVLLTEPVFDGGVDGVVGGGERSSGMMKAGTGRNSRSIDYGKMPDVATLSDTYGDSGGVSRIFIIPKAARSEKEPLFDPYQLEETTTVGPMAGRGQPGLKCRKCHRWKVSGNPCTCDEPDFEAQPFNRPKVKNDHPTVKPLDLICHLVRLVCPPGAVVLDPFLGSGTTAKAAELEGRQWIGIERDPHFARIARARLSGTQRGLGLE